MSITNVRPYFNTKLKGLAYKEHRDAFNVNNIASTVTDKAYHIFINPISVESTSNLGQELTANLNLQLIYKGARDMTEGIERAERLSQEVLISLMSPDRLTQPGIKTVLFESINFEQFDSSNDNIIRCTMTFIVYYYLCY